MMTHRPHGHPPRAGHRLGRHLVHAGDNLELLRRLPDNSVDAVVTDPPYGLGRHPDAVAMLRDWLDTGYHEVRGTGFMGRAWDAFVPQPVLWREVARVLRPGGHLVAFFGTRTYDVGTLSIRLAGLEVRDALAWVYGSGFPKSHNVAIALDKLAGAMGHRGKAHHAYATGTDFQDRLLAPYSDVGGHVPITDAARQWDGWGTALKPALEPIALCRLPPSESSIARNVLRWGTGGINVRGCEVPAGPGHDARRPAPAYEGLSGGGAFQIRERRVEDQPRRAGRWPANLIHDGSPEAVAGMPETTSGKMYPTQSEVKRSTFGADRRGGWITMETYGDTGSAARYFYSAKTSPAERAGSRHPTIKPLALMRYLVRLVTPPGGVVLDPYLGSGTTLLAAEAEGVTCYGAEAEHLEDILHRWDHRHEIRRASEGVQETAGGRDEHEAQGELFPGMAP